ncbi:ABC transporter permease, partial [Streptococcus agalactiae]|nr:ABC transporter permease [Streptococcus agalactiae]MDE7498189.1 ABC transporter permease [Streptococcus agalactiae]
YCLAITVVFLTGHILRQVSMPIEQWMQSFLLLLGGATCFIPFGLLVSYFKNTELMSMVANICYMSLAVLGGMWMPITMFPKWLQALSKLTPTYHLTQVILSPFANSFAGFSLIILIGYG